MNKLKEFLKATCIYVILFILTYILFKTKVVNLVQVFFLNTILLIILTRLLNLNKSSIIIFFSILSIIILIFSLDINYYYEFYTLIGYLPQGTILSEFWFNFLLFLNIPFLGMLDLLKNYNILNLRFFLIPMYILIVIFVSIKFRNSSAS